MEFVDPNCLHIKTDAVAWGVTAGSSCQKYNDASTTASKSDQLSCMDDVGWDPLKMHESCNILMEPYSASCYQWDGNSPSSSRSAEPDLPCKASKRQLRVNETDEHFDMPLLTPENSPAPSHLNVPKFHYSRQESLSDSGQYLDNNGEVRETEYNKEFVEECLMPFSDIQNDLIMLYFAHVHPMFPMIDKYSLVESYHAYQDSNELMPPKHLLLLLAISFVAFTHVNEGLLSRTLYSSIHKGQKLQFEIIKELYHLRITRDPLTLAQVSILLSFWSPCDSESEVNSRWIARGFDHARQALVWIRLQAYRKDYCYRRWNILWWCCLIRERMVALGMRRPERLLKLEAQPELPTEVDFGIDAMISRCSIVSRKRKQVKLFLLLCKLSIIMEDIAVLQKNLHYSKIWDSKNWELTQQEVEVVMTCEIKLRAWKRDLNHVVGIRARRRDAIPMSYVLQIMGDSLLASIYSPYLCNLTHSTSLSVRFARSALELVKESSRNVAQGLRVLLNITRLEGVPSYLVSWIALPTAVDYVLEHISEGQPPDNTLKLSLLELRNRYQSAHFVSLIIDDTLRTQSLEDRDSAFYNLILYATQLPAYENLYLGNERSAQKPSEAEVLHRVARAIDTGLANDIRGLESNDAQLSAVEIRQHTAMVP